MFINLIIIAIVAFIGSSLIHRSIVSGLLHTVTAIAVIGFIWITAIAVHFIH